MPVPLHRDVPWAPLWVTAGRMLWGWCPCCPCCPPAARLLVSFTWIPSRSDWKHPGTTLPMRITSVPAGEVSSPKESNWERTQITARNLLVFI